MQKTWKPTERRLLRCVDYSYLLEDSGNEEHEATYACDFDVRASDGRWRFGTVGLDVRRDGVVESGIRFVRAYNRKSRRCAWSPGRPFGRRVTGTITTVGLECGQQRPSSAPWMAGDVVGPAARRFPAAVKTFRTGFGGTNTADWTEWSVLRCTRTTKRVGATRRYDVRCKNKIGWSFRARFTIHPKPRAKAKPKRSAPKPRAPKPRPAPKCNPNYSGVCLPIGGDVNCGDISARDFKVVGTDVFRLDGDGDGIACES